MSRLFTHHDRLYLYSSPASPTVSSFPKKAGKEATETDEDNTPAPSHGGFAVFVPHFHKVWGLLALLNMLIYQTPLFHKFEQYFGADRLLRFSLVHVILALSSFEFRIGRARNGIYTIYREMQLHTIIFTMRSFSGLVLAWGLGVENIVSRMFVMLFWHVLADVATKLYRPPSGETTIRRSVDGKMGYQEHGKLAHAGLWFFSFSQLVGTYMLITDTADLPRNSMFIMTPVQVSAFLATLVRKGYTSSQTSVGIYFMVLQPIFFYHHWTLLDVLMVAAAQFLRFQFRLNKYIMWISIGLTVAYVHGDVHQFLYGIAPEVAKAVPAVPPLPAWFTVDTVQPGTAIGNFFTNLYTSLVQ